MKISREKIVNPLNLHLLTVGLLLLLDLALAVHLIVSWHAQKAAGPEALAQEQAAYRTLELQMRPLHGLPEKVTQARDQAQAFYDQRFPDAYSTISAAIGELASSSNVRLTRVSYTQSRAIPGLADVRMDASLSGEYAPLMHFINGLERSKTFFLIDGLTLTGQQGGMVNLRLRLTTYLHAADLEHLSPPADQNQAPEPEEEGQ